MTHAKHKGNYMALRPSARNRLPGIVMGVKLGEVMAQIDVRVGDNHMVSLISREAAEELELQEGDSVLVVVKATDVMVARIDDEDLHHGV